MTSTLPLATGAQLIDLAARQRMLNQRFMKEILAQLLGAASNPTLTLEVLRETGRALVDGGEAALVPGGPPAVALPLPPTPEIAAQLGLYMDLLSALEEAAGHVVSKDFADPNLKEFLAALLSAGERLHANADRATQMLAEHFQAEKDRMEQRERETSVAIRDVLAVVAEQSEQLAGSSGALSAASRDMLGNAEETSSQATRVSGASERIAQVLHSVAAATEELNASIRQISSNANNAAQTVGEAVKIASQTNQSVEHLQRSSADIGGVVNLITSVAEQTNLLALNAAIEAAHAGDAGRGFAVVAHEVKELAKQTARATEDIRQKINAMQADTRAAIRAMGEIDRIIGGVSIASSEIAAATEEQTLVTGEIAGSLAQATAGVSDITTGIAGVADVAQRTSSGASQSLDAATGLARMAQALRKVAVSLEK